jgi:uncharacterized protein (DUF1697 family)
VATYVALLRAINLGKQRRVAMGKLRNALTDAGYDDVATHLQSGNVVLTSRARSSTSVEKTIEKLVSAEFGLDVDVMVRTASELATVVKTNPLLGPRVRPAALHVAFLKARPSAAAVKAIAGQKFGRDEFVVRGTEIYLKYPNGVAGSKMSTPVFEQALGTPGTVRTWKVVTRLQELTEAPRAGK